MATGTLTPIAVQLHQTYEAPASLLSDDPVEEQDVSSLRAEASADGVCYLRPLRLLEDGIYLVRVAARPGRVMQGFTLIVTDEQMAQAQPYQQA